MFLPNKILENNKKNYYNKLIDFTYLKPNSERKVIQDFCNKAKNMDVYAVCVLPEYISDSKLFLQNSGIKTCTVIDFPKGKKSTSERLEELQKAIIAEVDEVDIVFPYNKLIKPDKEDINKTIEEIRLDLKTLVHECKINGVVIKMILEIEALTFDQMKTAAKLCKEESVDFIQTSTGTFVRDDGNDEFSKFERVIFLRRVLPDAVQIKVAGGIRSLDDVEKYAAEIERIGTSTPMLLSGNINK